MCPATLRRFQLSRFHGQVSKKLQLTLQETLLQGMATAPIPSNPVGPGAKPQRVLIRIATCQSGRIERVWMFKRLGQHSSKGSGPCEIPFKVQLIRCKSHPIRATRRGTFRAVQIKQARARPAGGFYPKTTSPSENGGIQAYSRHTHFAKGTLLSF